MSFTILNYSIFIDKISRLLIANLFKHHSDEPFPPIVVF